jgi:hypothetical protein
MDIFYLVFADYLFEEFKSIFLMENYKTSK